MTTAPFEHPKGSYVGIFFWGGPIRALITHRLDAVGKDEAARLIALGLGLRGQLVEMLHQLLRLLVLRAHMHHLPQEP
eukprot:1177297-Prorocentrum_minimum.AAC.5